jgi:hypothetical protein
MDQSHARHLHPSVDPATDGERRHSIRIRWISLFLLSLAAVLLNVLPGLLSSAGGRRPVVSSEQLPTPRPAEPCDICEPNNSLSEACGPLAAGWDYRYLIRCTAGLDDDFYYFDLETPGKAVLHLADIPSGADYSIYLYDENKRLICYSDQRGNRPEHVECDLSQLGRYYVRVYPWTGCNDNDPYTLAVSYPTPAPTPVPSPTPTPRCNVHVDDFYGSSPYNDLGLSSGSELDPPGCGIITVTHTGFELQLDYDVTSPGCTARYTTGLSLDAQPYDLLAFEIKGHDREELASTIVGLSDEAGHRTGVKVGDFLNQVLTDTWQAGNVPLTVFATAVDTTRLDTLFVEFADAQGASQGTIYLDSPRLEMPLAPLTVDNFDDLTDPNGLGGGTGIYADAGATLETAYTVDSTHDRSPGSHVISYTLPSGTWALWETYTLGVDVSDYALLSFYLKGADGGEKVNLYLEDEDGRKEYVDLEDYVPNGAISTNWTAVRVPLQAFKGLMLTHLDKIKFVFEWEPMNGAIFLDDLRFVADTLLIDSFCDQDNNNSLNGDMGLFTSAPSCTAIVTPTLSDDSLRLDYDVTAGPDCYSGYWSQTRLDLNPYRTLTARVRGARYGQAAAISARTIPVSTDKLKLSDYLLDGITDQWQRVRIPLAASPNVTDWTQGDSYVIAFEAGQGASAGTIWWDDVAFETACVPLWVDNFNDADEGDYNALVGYSSVFGEQAEITRTTSITQAYGDAGAGLALSYAIPAGKYAGWETDLRNADLSDYDRLVFNARRSVSGDILHIYLKESGGRKAWVPLDDYAKLSTGWQTIAIPLEHFIDLDLRQIQHLQFIIEWESADVEGTLFLDNIRFLPSADCSQITQSQVHVPLIAKGLAPLTLDPVWDFEDGTDGWIHQTYADSQAVIATESSPFRAQWGRASLAMVVDLIGGDDHRDQGEAFVDLANTPLPNLSVPLDLACKPISCWVYVPTCGLGDPAEPNVVQLFVKDTNGKSEYGPPTRVLRNQWFEVNIRPSTLQPKDGYMDTGFSPSAIEQLGIRFKAGRAGVTYRGKVYVDACGWQEIDPGGAAAAQTCQSGKGAGRRLPPLPRLEE